MLLHSLEEDASPYMKDITTTIQQEQNQIIRDANAATPTSQRDCW